jgi:hypothetical protein
MVLRTRPAPLVAAPFPTRLARAAASSEGRQGVAIAAPVRLVQEGHVPDDESDGVRRARLLRHPVADGHPRSPRLRHVPRVSPSFASMRSLVRGFDECSGSGAAGGSSSAASDTRAATGDHRFTQSIEEAARSRRWLAGRVDARSGGAVDAALPRRPVPALSAGAVKNDAGARTAPT